MNVGGEKGLFIYGKCRHIDYWKTHLEEALSKFKIILVYSLLLSLPLCGISGKLLSTLSFRFSGMSELIKIVSKINIGFTGI